MRRGVQHKPQITVEYGPGGVGKTELAANMQVVGVTPLFLDLEDGSGELDVARVEPTPETLDEVRQVLHGPALQGDHGAFVVDSFTRLEDIVSAWVIENIKHEKGHYVDFIEGFGYGKGYTHIYETFLKILGDLDAIVRAGKHVVGICHDCIANVPNPGGEDWIRYEPRLQQPPKTGQLRSRVKEWCDHLLYIGFDIAVSKDGKAVGGGTRTIYPVERPTHLAKSRKLSDPVVYERGSAEIWNLLLKGE